MSGVAGKYENQSQHLFVSSEAAYESIGNQNHFRVSLNSMPFKNEDNTILRMCLKQLPDMIIEITCTATSFVWGEPVNFACLNIPTNAVYTLDDGTSSAGTVVTSE